MNAKTTAGAAGLTRRALPGSASGLAATALTAATQSAFPSGGADDGFDI